MAKVLIVEDDAVMRAAYQIVLQREGHFVVVAVNGAEALGLALQHSPQVILLDMLMPQRTGLEFLRSYGPHRPAETKVVALSNIEDYRQDAYQSGVNEFWVKASFTPHEVSQKVAELLAF